MKREGERGREKEREREGERGRERERRRDNNQKCEHMELYTHL